MPTKDFDPTQLQHWTVENGCSSIHPSISEPEYTYNHEWEPIKELTFRQKLALKRIIFKAWLRRILGIE